MLIALSFCNKDQDQAERLAQWMAELGCGKGHELLLGISVAPSDGDRISEIFKQAFGKVTVLPIKNPYSDWPAAPNHAFQEISRYIEEKQLAKYFCWIEPDCVVLSADCFTALEAEHLKGGKAFTGAFVKGIEGSVDHMSGIGVYPGNLTHHAGPMLLATTTPFDIAAADMVMPRAHFTDLVFHRWKGLKFDTLQDLRDMIGPAPVLYHSDKIGALIEMLRAEKNLPVPVLAEPQNETLTCAKGRGEARESNVVGDPMPLEKSRVVGDPRGGQTLPDIAETDRTLKRFMGESVAEAGRYELKDGRWVEVGPAWHAIVPWRDKAESIAEIKRLCVDLKAFCKAPHLTKHVRQELKDAGVIKKVR